MKFYRRDLFVLLACVDMQQGGQKPLIAQPGEGAACRRLHRAGLLYREPGTRDHYLPTQLGEQMTDRLLAAMTRALEQRHEKIQSAEAFEDRDEVRGEPAVDGLASDQG